MESPPSYTIQPQTEPNIPPSSSSTPSASTPIISSSTTSTSKPRSILASLLKPFKGWSTSLLRPRDDDDDDYNFPCGHRRGVADNYDDTNFPCSHRRGVEDDS
ncbi:hypothetical protein K432DRAFT_395315 [Lepidopterella palustris CBS 459.81]|uniref:Uncharacterized protein n=1 Tax=Lepidopterella palustris CBS 459.81 TaxID=1314670 RepID=A0A8E2E5K7_9PEZI|nr:hypothetical protein K432DRAFT_395315 [Lepidopterella palustris CBS 459.81]